MPRQSTWEDEPDDYDGWGEASDEVDGWGDPAADDDDEPTIPCPYCRREIHEDSQQCPNCEQYISREDAPSTPKPWWLVAGVAVCLFIVCLWIFAH